MQNEQKINAIDNSPTCVNKKSKIKAFPLLKRKKNRIWELDFLRGLCVLLMIWDHFMYNVAFIFGDSWVMTHPNAVNFLEFAQDYWYGDLRTLFHPIIFCLFFIMCGISCSLSRNNLKRGLQALTISFAITLVTSLFDMPIRFGVIHMLAFAILFYWIINTISLHNKKLTSLICLISGIVIIIVNNVYTQKPPETLSPQLAFIADFFGGSLYESYDYFPLLPWVGYMLLGASVGEYIYGNKQSLFPKLDKYGWHKPISFWGDKALLVYVLHQPIIIGILSLLSYLFITPGNWIFF